MLTISRISTGFLVALIILCPCLAEPTRQPAVRSLPIAKGWAKNGVNTTIFRHQAVATHGNNQYAAFYDPNGRVVLARRELDTEHWQISTTRYKGNVKDAHNGISIGVDGLGFVHMSWDHHVSPLHYVRSTAPGSLELTEPMRMVGMHEGAVTYPEFYNLPDGDLLFLYRDGASGRGNLVLNRYDVTARTWQRLHDVLIDGEGERNAYWQTTVGPRGVVHLSWVWRETSDVATNHDLCYARSDDGGRTWRRSTGEPYTLPITAATAEYAVRIPQKSELINHTSMCVDGRDRPCIATYWRPPNTTVPQYHVVYHDGREWKTIQVGHRTQPFSLSGKGTRRIPISRPVLLATSGPNIPELIMVFRDIERGSRVSAALCNDLKSNAWRIVDLTEASVGMWEPNHDPIRWRRDGIVAMLVQNVGQGQGETLEEVPPQTVSVLEWKPEKRK